MTPSPAAPRPLPRSFGRVVAVVLLAGSSAAAGPVPFGEVRPIFEKRCLGCHGAEKQKGGLRFDARSGAVRDGDSGLTAIVPGNAAESRLVELVTSRDPLEQMPPEGERLTQEEVDLLRKWIDAGADWPEGGAPAMPTGGELVVTDADRDHWSFRPLRDVPPPDVIDSSGIRAPVDRFVTAKLEAAGLTPAAGADRRTLIRRLSFDLLGLPPSPEAVEAFVADVDPLAYERLVDRLLADPRYGERWGRHWLDVARYADSNGQEGDQDRPTAYRYRDFVLRALNEDLPYDDFVRRQLAGDEIAPDDPLAVAATGFVVAGPHTVLDVPMEEEKVRNRFNELDDMLATTGSAFLGLTVACARCHDHKYDAIPTRDYYRLLAAFQSGDRAEVPVVPRDEAARHRRAEEDWKRRHDAAKADLDGWLAEAKWPHAHRLRGEKIDAPPLSPEDKRLIRSSPDDERAKKRAKKHEKELKLDDADYRRVLSDEQRSRWDELAAAVKAVESERPAPLPTALAMRDFGPTPREAWLLDRGDFRVKKEPVGLGFLTVLTGDKPAEAYLAEARSAGDRGDTTYQRRAIAEWMTDLDHGAGGLAARVIVNRLWQHHFGEGLVRTVNDFGVQGEWPSHPELLEHLAAELVRGGWRLKPVHRSILTSAAYRRSTAFDLAKAAVDPENRLLWRRRPLRIESEALRDALLAASGRLNPGLYGPAFKPFIPNEAMQARNLKTPYPKDVTESPDTLRRTVYLFHKRVIQYPLMQAFDGPDAAASCGRRNVTTVALQALALLNDPFVRTRAAEFAGRLRREADDDPASLVTHAFRLAFGRSPSPTELRAGSEFLTRPADDPLTDFCQVVFGLNEFLYVD